MLTFVAALVTGIQAEVNVPGAVSERQHGYLGTKLESHRPHAV